MRYDSPDHQSSVVFGQCRRMTPLSDQIYSIIVDFITMMQTTVGHRAVTCASSVGGMPRQARRMACVGARLQSYTSTLSTNVRKIAHVYGKRGYVRNLSRCLRSEEMTILT